MRRGGKRGGRQGPGARGGRPTGAAMLRSKLVQSEQTNSARRLHKDYYELKNAIVPLVGVSACPTDDNLFTWCANIRGPEQSAFYGGVFHMEIIFPQDYPVSPPKITLFNVGSSFPHPNVFGSSICLDMLQPKKN